MNDIQVPLNKLTGSIQERQTKKGVSYLVAIKSGGVRYFTTFKTHAEAEAHLRAKNTEFNLPIKNSITRVDNTLHVKLTRDKTAIVDADRLDLIQTHTWYASVKNHTTYVGTTFNNQQVMLHQIIMNRVGVNDGMVIDHINNNGLDNRRENLRVVTPQQNSMNRAVGSNNKLGVKGVYLRDGKYVVTVYRDGRREYTGSFNTLNEAINAYNNNAVELFGEFAKLVQNP